MAMEQDKLGLEVYKILAAREYGYNMTMYDTESNPTTTPLKAKWIYIKPVNFMLQLPDADARERPEIYFWKQQGEHDEIVEQLIQRIRKACNQFGVGLTVNDFAQQNVPKQLQKIVTRHNEERQMDESVHLDEGMTGSSQRSYYVLENARLVVMHGKRINEEIHGARSRNIKQIYVENSNGERFKYPTTYLQGAKAMCHHVNNGGGWTDAIGTVIKESGREIMAMNTLIRECKQNGCWPIYEKARRYVSEVKSDMKKMQGPRGYQRISERISKTPRIGKQVVESRCASISALTGLTESEDLLEAYQYFARRDLHEDRINEKSYKKVIEGMMSIDPRLATGASRAITRGDVCFMSPMRCIDADTGPHEKVMMYASALADVIDNNTISVALSELCEKAELTTEDAKFVAGVLKSAKLNEFKTKQQPDNELQELTEWINNLTSDLL